MNDLNPEKYAYSMQCRQLQMDVEQMLSRQALPLLGNLAQAAEITRNKAALLFELFRQFGENPSEIRDRFYWLYYNQVRDNPYKGRTCYLDTTICTVTRFALMSSVFGLAGGARANDPLATIRQNSKRLLPSEFIVYAFGINAHYGFPGHTFVVVQYADFRYRMFQSFIDEYQMRGDEVNPLDFFKGLKACVTSEEWTEELEFFFRKYFHVDSRIIPGDCNPCKGGLSLEWGEARFEDVLVQSQAFELCRRNSDFPKIESDERLPAFEIDLAARKVLVESIDKKLRAEYQKLERVKGPIPLDLDCWIDDEAMVLVPFRNARDEFVLDENGYVVWVKKMVTLKEVATDVISELNRLILTGENKILLNTNREPFRSYCNLGAPASKYILDEEDQKTYWLYRIIENLVDKGYLHKLISVNGHGYTVTVRDHLGYSRREQKELEKSGLWKKVETLEIPADRLRGKSPSKLFETAKYPQEALLYLVIGADTSLFTQTWEIPEGAWKSFIVRIDNWGLGYTADQKKYGEMMCRGALILAAEIQANLPFADLIDVAAFLRFEIAESLHHHDWKRFGQRTLFLIYTDCSSGRYAPLGEHLRNHPMSEPLHCVPSEINPSTTNLLKNINLEWKLIKMEFEESYQEFIIAEGIPPEFRQIMSCETSLFASLLHSKPANANKLLQRAERCYNDALRETSKDRLLCLLGECFWWICTAKPWERGDPSIAEMIVKGALHFKGHGFPCWQTGIIPWAEAVKCRTPQEFGAKFHTLLELEKVS